MTPSPKINTAFAEELVGLYLHPQKPHTVPELVKICEERNIQVSVRTIRTMLKDHCARKRNENVDCSALRVLIATLYFQQCLPDKVIHQIINKEGYPIAFRTFVQLRRTMGIKRKRSLSEFEAHYNEFKAIISTELDKGTISSYGRTMLATYFRSKPSLQMLIGR